MQRLLAACEQRAAAQHGWNDFAPVGLLIDMRGNVQALAGYPLGTPVSDVAQMLTRAGAPMRRQLYAVGMICSAWASVSAVEAGIDPSAAPDRTRARLTAAVNREYVLHMLNHIAASGMAYNTDPQPMGGVGELLAGVMHQLTTARRQP